MKGVRNQEDRGLSCSDPGQGPQGGLADIHNRKGEHGDGSEGSQADMALLNSQELTAAPVKSGWEGA